MDNDFIGRCWSGAPANIGKRAGCWGGACRQGNRPGKEPLDNIGLDRGELVQNVRGSISGGNCVNVLFLPTGFEYRPAKQ